MSSNIIRLLPDHIANQIAAGEVVQRPASVVKELIENSVDAGATSISLIVKDAGRTLIQVTDNGKGMSETDARICFERHATSKISCAEDLFNLHTKGFRGEALASICAVAHIELKTKQPESEFGTHIVMEGSKIISQEVGIVPSGTSIIVKNLFFNIPARRNFLKSDNVEMRHIIDEFQRVALTHPDIHFSLISNGNELFNLPVSNLRQRIVGVFGSRTNEKLVPIEEETEIATVYGFVGKPEFAKKTRGEQFFFVNNRFIKNGYLHHAVTAAFEGLLKSGTHPSYFIYLNLPPHTIDINIHPTKTEIKFENEQALYAIIRATIKRSFGQFQVAPALDFQRDSSFDIPYSMLGTEGIAPTIEIDTSFNPFMPQAEEKQSKSSSSKSINYNNYSAKPQEWDSLYNGLPIDTQNILSSQINIEKDEETISMFEEKNIVHNYTYQIHKKYIVSPIKSGVVIIDQNRAHQRILFEQYKKNLNKTSNASQQLLFPIVEHYTPMEVETINQLVVFLTNIGFVFDKITTEEVVISGIPVGISEREVSNIIENLLADCHNDMAENTDIVKNKIATTIAVSLAIKTGTALDNKEQENIVNELFACEEPNLSPLNKKIYVMMNIEEIDKKFI